MGIDSKVKAKKRIKENKTNDFKKNFTKFFKPVKKPTTVPPILEMLVLIINKEKSDYACELLKSLKSDLNVACRGKGTASSSMANLFGLGSLEKDIIISIIKLKDSEKILQTLNEKLQLEHKHYGIAFTIPMKSATSELLEEVGYYF